MDTPWGLSQYSFIKRKKILRFYFVNSEHLTAIRVSDLVTLAMKL